MCLFVRGHDFLCAGPRAALEWLQVESAKAWCIKSKLVGAGKDRSKDRRVLNRLIQFDPVAGISYEADPRRSAIFIKELGVEGQPSLSTPGVKSEGGRIKQSMLTSSARTGRDSLANERQTCSLTKRSPPLVGAELIRFRGLVARANFLVADRPDIFGCEGSRATHEQAQAIRSGPYG